MSAVNLEHVKQYEWASVAARVRVEYLVAIANRAARSGGERRALPGGAAAPPRLEAAPRSPRSS
jgi:hypothetical protein